MMLMLSHKKGGAKLEWRRDGSVVGSFIGDTDDEEWWGRWCGGQERWRHICGNSCAWVRSYPLTTHLLCVNVTNWLPLDQNTNYNATMVICAECRSFLRRYSCVVGHSSAVVYPHSTLLVHCWTGWVYVCMYVCMYIGWLINFLTEMHPYLHTT